MLNANPADLSGEGTNMKLTEECNVATNDTLGLGERHDDDTFIIEPDLKKKQGTSRNRIEQVIAI